MPPGHHSHSRASSFAGGRYELIREIGRGGTAVVHLAREHPSGKFCAIKILATKYAAREDIRQRFRRECDAMAQIRHPSVLRVITWGIAEGSMFLVTEFAEGGSIGRWVRRHGPMGAHRAIDLTRQVCDGVSAAHAIGVVHRDVKPDNVLIASDGTLRVCDFGIAQVRMGDSDPLTRTGTSIGTLGFMAPEQCDHARDVDRRADVYSIAATLWFLLRGRVPPHAFHADPWESGIPGPLCPVIGRATAFRRDQRHGDVLELQAELESIRSRLNPDAADQPSLVDGPVEIGEALTETPSSASDEPEVTWIDPESDTL